VLSRRPAGDEAGFTVVELMITVMISMIVMSSLLGLLTSQTKAERRVHAVANSQEAIRLAYVELTRDLRSADPLVAASASSVEVELRALDGPVRRLRWSVEPDAAGALELVRTEIATDGTESASYRLPGIASSDVFTFFKAGTTPIEVRAGDEPRCAKRSSVVLLATAEGEGAPLRLESDVDLRNAKVSALC
jgi:type II secretory pathway pseudopilin PulG